LSSSQDQARIIVALDFPEPGKALSLASKLSPELCRLKVGKTLFTAAGPRLVERLVGAGYDVFLDLKFHDIPNTVAGACSTAANLGVWMLDVHASGGRAMLEAAREALGGNEDRPLLIAVTVLTSLTDADMDEIGMLAGTAGSVDRLARLARDCELDGVVCSPLEIAPLRRSVGTAFRLITPGIRPSGSRDDDQRRVMNPGAAIRAGSDYLVIGRPITAAEQPSRRVEEINSEIARAFDESTNL